MGSIDDDSEKGPVDTYLSVSRRHARPTLIVATCLVATVTVLSVFFLRRQPGQDELHGGSEAFTRQPLDWFPTVDWRWLMEDLLRIGSITLGLPGLTALGVMSTPMLESIPRILTTGNVGKLPLLPYSAMVSSGALWLSYGLLVGSPVVWFPNAIQVVLGIVYSSIFLRYCPAKADWLPWNRAHHLAFCSVIACGCISFPVLLPLSVAARLLGLLGSALTVVMFAGPLAAIRTVLADRNTRSLPFGFTCVVTVNCSLWLSYGWCMAGDPFIYVPNFMGLLVACLQLSLFFRFGLAH